MNTRPQAAETGFYFWLRISVGTTAVPPIPRPHAPAPDSKSATDEGSAHNLHKSDIEYVSARITHYSKGGVG